MASIITNLDLKDTTSLYRAYLDWYLLYKNPSPSACETVRYHAKAVLFSPQLLNKPFTLKTCIGYISELKEREARGELSRNTVYSYVKVLRSIIEFLSTQHGLQDFRPKLPKIKRMETIINPLTPEEIAKIINVPIDNMGRQRDPLMYNALLSLMAYSGRRINEILKLHITDLDFASGFMLLRRPKGGNPEWLPLPDGAKAYLQAYLKERQPMDFVFSERGSGQPLWPQTVRRELVKRAQVAGVTKPVNPHNFRHSFPRPLLKQSVPLPVVKELLGHKSIVTTMRYTHLLPDDLRDASVLHPGNSIGITGEKIATMFLKLVETYRDIKTTFHFTVNSRHKRLEITFEWED